ncbi:MerR family transcriptional regulator [Actinokineospora sp. 24-640]
MAVSDSTVMGDDERAVWTAGQVARELRLPESTLRAWHRRYGLGPHAPRPGQYRRYGTEDVARLRHMRELVDAGMLPSDAAAAVTGQDRPLGEVLADVLAAARRLDTTECARLLDRTRAAVGVVPLWDLVCRPALLAADADQRAEPDSVDTEHALSWAVTTALHRVPHPPHPAAILLACADGEQHALPLEALAAALAERGVPTHMLGAAVPAAALLRAVRTTSPRAVVLWSHHRDTAHPGPVRALARLGPLAVVAGPGWQRRPPGSVRVGSLAEAVERLG